MIGDRCIESRKKQDEVSDANDKRSRKRMCLFNKVVMLFIYEGRHKLRPFFLKVSLAHTMTLLITKVIEMLR